MKAFFNVLLGLMAWFMIGMLVGGGMTLGNHFAEKWIKRAGKKSAEWQRAEVVN
jgi:hypothetical protein